MTRRLVLAGALALVASFAIVSSAQAAFGIAAFDVTYNSNGTPAGPAGSHDFDLTTRFALTTRQDSVLGEVPEGSLDNLTVSLPTGLAGNPTSTPRCSGAEFADIPALPPKFPACANDAAIGVAAVRVKVLEEISWYDAPIYNLEGPPGAPAKLGFVVLGVPVTIIARLDPQAPHRIEATVTHTSQALALYGGSLTIWGDPAAPAHDTERGRCVDILNRQATPAIGSTGSCPYGGSGQAFLSLPTSCAQPAVATYEANSWQDPTATLRGQAPTALTASDCAALEFAPTMTVRPTSPVAESPSGLEANLDVDQAGALDPARRSPSAIERVVVTLPPGVTTNPAVANGLVACTLAQFEAETVEPGSGCPGAAKIGGAELETPLLQGSVLPGSIYIGKQHDNPFDDLLTIYLVVKDPGFGILIAQAGRVEPDPVTGQLTTTFDELPALPLSHLRLNFRDGARAPLTTPATCGTYTEQTTLYPYAEGTPVAQRATPFMVSVAPGGGTCATTPTAQPAAASLQAGTLDPRAGAYSPLVFRLTRADGSQQFSTISGALPAGLLGKLAGTPHCPEAAIAAAAGRTAEGAGALESAAPSCPAASQIGTVTVAAGAGPEPLYVSGRAYLAGPYRGAPVSLEVVTPALAGPFDLGVVAVRIALQVDPFTARITAVSAPIPTILHGLPLDVHSIELDASKPGFTLNPTSCGPRSIDASVTTTIGATVTASQLFQTAACRALAFQPRLSLNLKGATKRAGHPALKAVLTYPRSASTNIARAQIGLPHSEFLDQENIGGECTQANLKAGTCPKKSIYGHAKAWSPLLDEPLEGPVYLGVGFGHKLPDLVADLDGQIRVLLDGTIDSDPQGGLRTTFATVPDAPVSRFVLELDGGKARGLLENSENLCRNDQRAAVGFVGQNGKRSRGAAKIANDCGSKKRRGHRSAKLRGAKHR